MPELVTLLNAVLSGLRLTLVMQMVDEVWKVSKNSRPHGPNQRKINVQIVTIPERIH